MFGALYMYIFDHSTLFFSTQHFLCNGILFFVYLNIYDLWKKGRGCEPQHITPKKCPNKVWDHLAAPNCSKVSLFTPSSTQKIIKGLKIFILKKSWLRSSQVMLCFKRYNLVRSMNQNDFLFKSQLCCFFLNSHADYVHYGSEL